MRKLNLTDVFRFSRLVKSSGMKDLVSEILHRASEVKANGTVSESDLYAVGIDAFMSILDVAAQKNVESDIYGFLAPVWEMTAEEVANLSIEAVVQNLRKMFSENDFSTFFERSETLTN